TGDSLIGAAKYEIWDPAGVSTVSIIYRHIWVGLKPLASLVIEVWSLKAFHEKAGRSQVESSFLLEDFLFAESPLLPPFHPHSRSDFRSVQVGCSQPVLPPDYRPRLHLQDESWARRLTQS